MKNKIKRGQTARRAQLLNTTRTWLSKMIAMFIAAFLLYGNVGTAFAGELSLDAAGTENIGEASSAYVLAGAGTGEEQTSRQEEVTQSGETAESGAEQTGGPAARNRPAGRRQRQRVVVTLSFISGMARVRRLLSM